MATTNNTVTIPQSTLDKIREALDATYEYLRDWDATRSHESWEKHNLKTGERSHWFQLWYDVKQALAALASTAGEKGEVVKAWQQNNGERIFRRQLRDGQHQCKILDGEWFDIYAYTESVWTEINPSELPA